MNVAPLALFDVATVEAASPGTSPAPENFAAMLLSAAPASVRNAVESPMMAPNPAVPEVVLPDPVITNLAAPMLPTSFARTPRPVLQMPTVADQATLQREVTEPVAEDGALKALTDAASPLDPVPPIAVAAIVASPPASGRIVLPGIAAAARVSPTVEAAAQPESDAPRRHDRPLQVNDGSPAQTFEVGNILPVIQPIFADSLPKLKPDGRLTASVDAKADRPPTLEPAALAAPTHVTVPARELVLPLAATPALAVAAVLLADAPAVETQPTQDAALVSPVPDARPGVTAGTIVLAVRNVQLLPPVLVAAVAAVQTSVVSPMPLVLASSPETFARAVEPTTTPKLVESSAARRLLPRTVAQSDEMAVVPVLVQQATAAEPAATAVAARNNAATTSSEPTQVDTEALGRVSIALDQRAAALHVHFTVDRTSTALALLDSARLLDGALQSSGTRLDQLSVDVRGSEGRSGSATGSESRNASPQPDGSGQHAPARDPRGQDAQRTFLPPSASRLPRGTAQDRFA